METGEKNVELKAQEMTGKRKRWRGWTKLDADKETKISKVFSGVRGMSTLLT